jgi:acyl-CoA synthetase (NDP forming)
MVSNKIGISKFAWVGDMVDVNESEILEYLLRDRETKVIVFYLESIKDPRRFMDLAKRSKKPVIVLKSGVSEESKVRAKTHTDSLSTSQEIYSGAFRQAGIREVDSVRDLFNYALMLERYGKKSIRKVAIVSNTGGSSIIAGDCCHRLGLKLSRFSERTEKEIREKYPRLKTINPLDIRADADGRRFKYVLDVIARDENVDAILVINQLKSCLLNPEELEVLKRVKTGKVIVDCAPGPEDFRKVKFFLRDSLPVYGSVRDAVKVLKIVSQ